MTPRETLLTALVVAVEKWLRPAVHVCRMIATGDDHYGPRCFKCDAETSIRDAYRALLAAPAAPAAPALDPELRQKIADRLALAYNRNPVLIAELCDEQIDRSGNLLGWLREVARLANPVDDRSLHPRGGQFSGGRERH